VEQYFNNFATIVAAGGYTAASGVLNVGSTTGITLNSGDTTHLLIYTVSGGSVTPVVNLKVTAVNSGTQFAVAADGSDSSASSGANVICVLSAASMNQIRTDQNGVGTYSSLPSTSSAHAGDTYHATDCPYSFRFNGSVWTAFHDTDAVVVPAAAGFSSVHTGTDTIFTTTGGMVTLYDDAGTGNQLSSYGVSVPGSTPYTYTAKIRYHMTADETGGLPGAGTYPSVFIGITDGTKYILLAIANNAGSNYNPSTYVGVQRWTTYNTFGTQVNLINVGTPAVNWLRIYNDGTNNNYYFSDDGYYWVKILTEGVTTYLTETKAIFGLNPYSTNYTGNSCVISLIHWAQT
jgi:hypothetical protein